MRREMYACKVVDGCTLFGWMDEYVVGVSEAAHGLVLRANRLYSLALRFGKARPPN